MSKKKNALAWLAGLDPAECSYNEWLLIGMALQAAGFRWQDWDAWSASDTARYHPGECERKWETFDPDAAAGVGVGTLIMIAKDHGAKDPDDVALDWGDDIPIVDPAYVETDLSSATLFTLRGEAVDELIEYLEAVYRPDEHVGYTVSFGQKPDGRYFPLRGHYDRTAGELLAELRRTRDIGAVFGDPDLFCGAYIRPNPLDGAGEKDANVVDFRYTIIESDEIDPEEQLALILALRLPCVAIVFSGKKSVHAIVRVDASDLKQYRERADKIHEECRRAGLAPDASTKNASRYSRMPGVTRDGIRQALIATNVGCRTYAEWVEWVAEQRDDLPPTRNLADVWASMPALADELIFGVLRRGHKCLLSGPSKAGKTFALIELAVAVAEGGKWFGRLCRQGRVLYVNLEVDEASALHRFPAVYAGLGLDPVHTANIDVLSLRGRAETLDNLAPQIIHRARAKGPSPEDGGYSLIIVDPIYKVLTGDENSASDMAFFTNQFDRICNALGCSVVFAHHHTKGKPGMKAAQDCNSGSGVFSRDPDAILDLSPLVVDESLRRAAFAPQLEQLVADAMDEHGLSEKPSSLLPDALASWADANLPEGADEDFVAAVGEIVGDGPLPTAFRLSFTLREFASPDPEDLWFRYPVHQMDENGVLRGCRIEGGAKPAEAGGGDKLQEFEQAFVEVADGLDQAPIADIAERLGVSEKTVQRRIDDHPGFKRGGGMCRRSDD